MSDDSIPMAKALAAGKAYGDQSPLAPKPYPRDPIFVPSGRKIDLDKRYTFGMLHGDFRYTYHDVSPSDSPKGPFFDVSDPSILITAEYVGKK